VVERKRLSWGWGVEAEVVGRPLYKAHRAARTFKEHDEQALQEIADVMGDETVLVARSRQLARDLSSYCAQTTKTSQVDQEAWDTSALRKDA